MYSNLLEYIDLAVTENSNQEITGKVMNAVLKTMVEQLGAGYQFAGVVEPATEPTLNQAALF